MCDTLNTAPRLTKALSGKGHADLLHLVPQLLLPPHLPQLEEGAHRRSACQLHEHHGRHGRSHPTSVAVLYARAAAGLFPRAHVATVAVSRPTSSATQGLPGLTRRVPAAPSPQASCWYFCVCWCSREGGALCRVLPRAGGRVRRRDRGALANSLAPRRWAVRLCCALRAGSSCVRAGRAAGTGSCVQRGTRRALPFLRRKLRGFVEIIGLRRLLRH
jgi:hypothetical protein